MEQVVTNKTLEKWEEKIKTEVAIIEVKEQKWYKKIFMFFRKIFNIKL